MEPLESTNTSVTTELPEKNVASNNDFSSSMTTLPPFNNWEFLEEYNRNKQYQIDCINNNMDKTEDDDNCCANDRHDTNNEQIKKVHHAFCFCYKYLCVFRTN